MTIDTTWKCAVALTAALGLVACNGSSGSSGNSDRNPDYSDHYDDDFQPDLRPDLPAEEQVRAAITPGFVGFSGIILALDTRTGLDPYYSFLGSAVRDPALEGVVWGSQEDAANNGWPNARRIHCEREANGTMVGSGQLTIFHRAGSGNAQLADGEEVIFGFGDCVPSGGIVSELRSDGAEVEDPTVQRFRSFSGGDGSEHVLVFALDEVENHRYGDFRLRAPEVAIQRLDRDTYHWRISNTHQGEPEAIELLGSRDGEPLELRILGRADGAEDASTVYSYKADDMSARNDLARFEVPNLELNYRRGEEPSSASGDYRVTTEFENRAGEPNTALDFVYRGAPRLEGGGFQVHGPDGTVYTFELDADPDYLWVTIDDADGERQAEGRIAQDFVVNRMR